MMKIGSWNVNSLTVRLDQVVDWMDLESIDLLSLQETKIINERFPKEVFESLGYHCVYDGQKSYNGVALISRIPFEDVAYGLPAFEDPQRRVIAATVKGVRVINIYVPNGAAVGTDKYDYKLSWLEALYAYLKEELERHAHLAIMGDFNIAPEDIDVHDPKAWEGSVLVSSLEREAFQSLLSLGLCDSYRTHYPDLTSYSWWDYRAGKFQRNHGMRIDFILLSEALQAHCQAAGIDKKPREHARPSDHAPVWVSVS